YVFQVAENAIERIKQTKKLLVGVHYSHESAYMARDDTGNPVGLDYDLIQRVAKALGKQPEIGVPDLKVAEVSYPNVDSLLLSGLRHGEIDVGIGEITRTKQRERRGIFFTRSYLKTPLVFLGNEGMHSTLKLKDRVGILRGTTYARAAEAIREKIS